MSGIGLLLLAAGTAGLAVTASPPSLNSGSTNDPHTTATTVTITTGGSGTYTYAWTLILTPGGVTINTPTGIGTSFTIDTDIGATVLATARCTVTDTISLETAIVDVDIEHIDFR